MHRKGTRIKCLVLGPFCVTEILVPQDKLRKHIPRECYCLHHTFNSAKASARVSPTLRIANFLAIYSQFAMHHIDENDVHRGERNESRDKCQKQRRARKLHAAVFECVFQHSSGLRNMQDLDIYQRRHQFSNATISFNATI